MENGRYGYSRKLAGIGILVAVLGLGLLAFGRSRDTAQATGPSDYDLSWFTIDGGGVMSSAGGDYELSGTIGQADAGGPLSGGEYTLTGGFWFPLLPGDVDGDGGITLGDYARLAPCMSGKDAVPPEGCASFDSDGDGHVDLKDFAAFENRFSGS